MRKEIRDKIGQLETELEAEYSKLEALLLQDNQDKITRKLRVQRRIISDLRKRISELWEVG